VPVEPVIDHFGDALPPLETPIKYVVVNTFLGKQGGHGLSATAFGGFGECFYQILRCHCLLLQQSAFILMILRPTDSAFVEASGAMIRDHQVQNGTDRNTTLTREAPGLSA
jgi:hypothetical protein